MGVARALLTGVAKRGPASAWKGRTKMSENAPRIPWLSQFDYESAVSAARRKNKPILLFFRSASCAGSAALEKGALEAPEVARRIAEATVPVMIDVESEEPNPITSA